MGATYRAFAVATEGDAAQACVRDVRFVGHPPKNYPRFDAPSRLAFSATALALWDAGLAPGEAPPDAGIVGTGPRGCLAANEAYFRDYVACGRTLGRGNLFIYTLPTSPLAEAAIHFRLGGPLLHVSAEPPSLTAALDRATALVESGEAAGMAAVCIEDSAALAFYVCATPQPAGPVATPSRRGPTLDEFARLARQYCAVAETVSALASTHGVSPA
jgi:3-oxoacyl-(acyl-carrier-protein) synthase